LIDAAQAAELDERLRGLKDELIHIGYRIPSLAREVEEIRRQLDATATRPGSEAPASTE